MRGGQVFVRAHPVDRPRAGESAAPRERALYVHGLGGASTNWTDLAGLLAVRFEGWALDLPGFGRSQPPPRGYSVHGHGRAVIDLLEHVRDLPGEAAGQPVHLLGNSLGGLVSLLVAARRPDLVASLTLVSPAMPVYRVPPAFSRALLLLLLPGIPTLAERRIAGIAPEEHVRSMIRMCFGDPDRVPRERLTQAVAGDARARRAAVGRPRADPQHARAAHLLPAAGPQRLAAGPRAAAADAGRLGARDQLVDPALAPRLAATVPDARLQLLDGVGHVAAAGDAGAGGPGGAGPRRGAARPGGSRSRPPARVNRRAASAVPASRARRGAAAGWRAPEPTCRRRRRAGGPVVVGRRLDGRADDRPSARPGSPPGRRIDRLPPVPPAGTVARGRGRTRRRSALRPSTGRPVRAGRPAGPLVAEREPAPRPRTPAPEPPGRFRRFVARYGWRAYAVPVLAVVTVDHARRPGADRARRDRRSPARLAPRRPPRSRRPPSEAPESVVPGPSDSAEVDAGPTASPATLTAEDYVEQGAGPVSVVDGTSEVMGTGPLQRFAVEIEHGIEVDAEAFAAAVEQTLGDSRSWGTAGGCRFQRVGRAAVAAGDYDFKVP